MNCTASLELIVTGCPVADPPGFINISDIKLFMRQWPHASSTVLDSIPDMIPLTHGAPAWQYLATPPNPNFSIVVEWNPNTNKWLWSANSGCGVSGAQGPGCSATPQGVYSASAPNVCSGYGIPRPTITVS